MYHGLHSMGVVRSCIDNYVSDNTYVHVMYMVSFSH